MAGTKRFKTGLFGYKKQDVYDFIEKLAKDLEEQIKTKDDEVSRLRNENKELKERVEKLDTKLDKVESDRAYIANAIIKAEEKARVIIEEAVVEAEQKKEQIEIDISRENARLEKVKQDLRQLKLNAVNAIKKYELQLIDLVGDYQGEAAYAAEETIRHQEEAACTIEETIRHQEEAAWITEETIQYQEEIIEPEEDAAVDSEPDEDEL